MIKCVDFTGISYTSSIISSNFWLLQCQEDLTLNCHTEIFYVLLDPNTLKMAKNVMQPRPNLNQRMLEERFHVGMNLH